MLICSLKREVVEATYRLRHIRLHTVPNFDVGGGCDPYFDVRLGDGKQMTFDYKKVRRNLVPLMSLLPQKNLCCRPSRAR